MDKKEIAHSLAAAIKLKLRMKVSRRITHSTLATSFALHVVLDAIAQDLDVDAQEFKKECGVGQPLAYFV